MGRMLVTAGGVMWEVPWGRAEGAVHWRVNPALHALCEEGQRLWCVNAAALWEEQASCHLQVCCEDPHPPTPTPKREALAEALEPLSPHLSRSSEVRPAPPLPRQVLVGSVLTRAQCFGRMCGVD